MCDGGGGGDGVAVESDTETENREQSMQESGGTFGGYGWLEVVGEGQCQIGHYSSQGVVMTLHSEVTMSVVYVMSDENGFNPITKKRAKVSEGFLRLGGL